MKKNLAFSIFEMVFLMTLLLQLVQMSEAQNSGCSDGSDDAVFVANKIVGCEGSFNNGGMLGTSAQSLCNLANGWHICRDENEVSQLGLNGALCESQSPQATFWGTQQKSGGNAMCDGGGHNDIFGCAKSVNSVSNSRLMASKCSVLKYAMTGNKIFTSEPFWRCDGACPTSELTDMYKQDSTQGGGVMCCKTQTSAPTTSLPTLRPTARPTAGKRYVYKPGQVTFNEAIAGCESDGLKLAMPKTSAENNAIKAILGASSCNNWAWMGGFQPKDVNKVFDWNVDNSVSVTPNQNWFWLDGTPFDFTDWAPTAPDDLFGGEGALIMFKFERTWTDLSSHNNNVCGYICESTGGYETCKKLDGGGWELFRHVNNDALYKEWFAANDSLQGTSNYGIVQRGQQSILYQHENQWSIPWNTVFPDLNQTQFLFSTDDCQLWMITNFGDVFENGNILNSYENSPRKIRNNSITLGSKSAKWYFRYSNTPNEDPLISINDHGANEPHMMYAEKRLSAPFKPSGYHFANGGRNVWIRKSLMPICVTPFDIVFVIDGSFSVGAVNFDLQLKFIGGIIRRLYVASRVGLITYGNTPNIELTLDDSIDSNQYSDLNAVANHVESVQYPDGNTFTKDALMASIDMYNTSLVLGRNRLVFLLTDGKPTIGQDACSNNLIRSKFDDLSVNVFEVMIGSNVDAILSSMDCLPKDPTTDIFNALTFTQSEFDRVTKEFLLNVCPSNGDQTLVTSPSQLRRRLLKSMHVID